MNVVAETVFSSLLALVAVTPLVLLGMRNELRPNRPRLLALSILVWMLTSLATCVNSIFFVDLPGDFHWNWLGKVSCVAAIGLLLTILPPDTLRESGIFRLPKRSAAVPILIMATLSALMGAAAGPAAGQVTIETLAYQATLPSLAEEPVFRGILPALLAGALGSPWRLVGARLGWWWPVCALLFGAGHGLFW
jgi:hypothetical protein